MPHNGPYGARDGHSPMMRRESTRIYLLMLQGKATSAEYVAQVRRESREYVARLRETAAAGSTWPCDPAP